jgi:hypothetical protein
MPRHSYWYPKETAGKRQQEEDTRKTLENMVRKAFPSGEY